MAEQEQSKKIKEEELKKLKEFVQEVQNLKIEYAENALRIEEISQNNKNVYEKIIAKGKAYNDYLNYLRDIYGDVNVDFRTGEITSKT